MSVVDRLIFFSEAPATARHRCLTVTPRFIDEQVKSSLYCTSKRPDKFRKGGKRDQILKAACDSESSRRRICTCYTDKGSKPSSIRPMRYQADRKGLRFEQCESSWIPPEWNGSDEDSRN